MKTAVLADLHLTDNFDTVKLPVLDWALREARLRKCDHLCCIGDLTAQGSEAQTAEVLKRLNASSIPYFSTPGNAELRIYPDGRTADKFDVKPPAGVPVILINTAKNEPAQEELSKLAALPDQAGFLLATHAPPRQWSAPAQEILAQARQRGAVSMVISGHSHHDEAEILRGLDPDKASGGPPMFAVLERQENGAWTRNDVVMPGVDPSEWSAGERESFRRDLGFTTMWESVSALEFAAGNQVRNVELRMGTDEYSKELVRAIGKWRDCGGELLSLHLPDLKLSDDDGALQYYTELALKLGCGRVTLHVPRVTAAGFASAKEQLLDKFGRILRPLLDHHVMIGIENLHTKAGENTFETRNFGCTIEECRQWILLLQEKFSSDLIGFHLDIGHCRNNAPISGRENLSDWYCAMGGLVNGWHLHQVAYHDGKFTNHTPLTGWYDKLISLSGLFMALRAGQLNHVPMFLESRTWEGNRQAFLKLTGLLK